MFRNFFMIQDQATEAASSGGGKEQPPIIDQESVSMMDQFAQQQEAKKNPGKDQPPAQTSSTKQPPAQTEETPVYEGLGGKFKTMEELNAYIKKLEEDKVASTLQSERASEQASTQATQQPPQQAEEDESLYDDMFENPKKFVEDLRESLKKDIRQENEKQKAHENFWNTFYDKYPVLKDYKQTVDLVQQAHFGTLKDMQIADAEKFILEKSSEMINHIRKGAGQQQVDVLDAGSATTVESNQADRGGAAPVVDSEPTSFTDQFKSWQEKKFGK